MENNLKYLIIPALEYWDKQQSKYTNFLENKVDSVSIKDLDLIHNEDSIIEFYDKNNNLLNKYNYEILGVYYNKYNVWTWSWVVPFFKNKQIRLAKKLLNYGLNIDKSNNSSSELYYLKAELVNARFQVSDIIQIHIHVALAIYLSKEEIKFIYPHKIKLNENDPDDYMTYFIIVLNDFEKK